MRGFSEEFSPPARGLRGEVGTHAIGLHSAVKIGAYLPYLAGDIYCSDWQGFRFTRAGMRCAWNRRFSTTAGVSRAKGTHG